MEHDPHAATMASDLQPRVAELEAALLGQDEQSRALLYMLEDLEENRRAIELAKKEWAEAFDAVRDPMFMHDAEFRVIRCNRAYMKAARKEFNEIIGKPYWEVFPQGSGPLPACLRTMEAGEKEEEVKLESGESFRSRSFAVGDAQGAYLFSVHIMEDVTERKQAETQLQLFKQLLDQSSDGIFIVDPVTSRFLDVNEAACLALGYTRAELLQRGVLDIQTDLRDIAAWQAHARELQAEGPALFEFAALRKDGSQFPVEVSTRHVTTGAQAYIITVVRDITARKRIEEVLIESKNRLRTVLDSVQAGIVIIDPEVHKIVDINPFAACMIGAPKENIVGAECHKFICPAERNECPVTDLHQTVENSERVLLTATGERREVIKTVATIMLGGRSHLLESFIDITERKREEMALRRANRALRTLSVCNEELIRAENEQDLLRDLCKLVVETAGFRFTWVGYVEHDAAKSVRPVAHFGVAEGYIECLRVTRDDTGRGQGPVGRAVRSGRPEFARDIRIDPHFAPWREQALQCGFASSISLPLFHDREVFGTFNIYAAEPNAFDDEEVKLLSELADDLAFGIATLRTRAAQGQSAQRLLRSLESTIVAIAATVEMRDPYTAGHQRRMAELAGAIAREMGLPEDEVHGIRLAGVIHDLGKISIAAEILAKPGKLSAIELMIIKTHPQAGYDILKEVDFPWPIAQLVLHHHERLDGSGYPGGLKGSDILLGARILAVADTVEAMSSHRPYRPGFGIDAALEDLTKNRGSLYDADVVDACLKLFREGRFAFETDGSSFVVKNAFNRRDSTRKPEQPS